MARITPIPTTRVSDTLAQQRLLNQLQTDQVDILRLQQQISTGRRIQLLSEDAAVIPIYYPRGFTLVREGFAPVEVTPLGLAGLETLRGAS